MAKKTEIRPLFDVKNEFVASMDRFIHEAGMLRDAVRTMLQMGKIPDAVRPLIEERLKAFDEARTGYNE